MGRTPPDAIIERVNQAVRAIHPDLAWTFCAGVDTAHAFALSGEGRAELRIIAERWRAEAPPDARFEFLSARPAAEEDSLLQVELRAGSGPPIDFASVRLGVERDDDRLLLHVSLFHPAFSDLPEAARGQIAFLALDHALGEDGVERWVGGIETVTASPAGGVDLVALRSLTRALAEQARPWVIAEYEEDGFLMLLTTCPSLKRWEHPRLDTCCMVTVSYDGGDDGLPEVDLDTLFGPLEDELMALVDDAESAEHFARVTGRGQRRNFIYLDGDSMDGARIEAWAEARGRMKVELIEDPSWDLLPRV